MRLWNTSDSPVGGWKYTFSDDKGNSYTARGTSKTTLLASVRAEMKANNVEIPTNLWDYVEDQICSRQPSGKCYYENKPGDQIAKAIHVFAGGIDKAASLIGVTSNLEKRARECTTCGRRRVRLNN